MTHVYNKNVTYSPHPKLLSRYNNSSYMTIKSSFYHFYTCANLSRESNSPTEGWSTEFRISGHLQRKDKTLTLHKTKL